MMGFVHGTAGRMHRLRMPACQAVPAPGRKIRKKNGEYRDRTFPETEKPENRLGNREERTTGGQEGTESADVLYTTPYWN